MAKAVRILIYEGSEEWLKATLERSIKARNPLGLIDITKKGKKGWQIKELFRRIYDDGKEPKRITTDLGKIIPKPKEVVVKWEEKES